MALPPPGLFIDRETILLSAEGKFLSDGEEITHERTVAAFHKHLGHDEEGYFIEIGRDFKRIEVEDTARFVQAIHWSSESQIELELLDGTTERLRPETLRLRDERLTCLVKDEKEEAKFLRAPYLEFFLKAHLQEEAGKFHVVIAEKKYELKP